MFSRCVLDDRWNVTPRCDTFRGDVRRRICEFFGKIGGWLEIKPTERWLASSFVEEAIRSLVTSNWSAAERSVAGGVWACGGDVAFICASVAGNLPHQKNLDFL